MISSTWIPIAKVDEEIEEHGRPFEINGVQLALFRINDEYFVTSNVCTHQFALMTDGYLDGCYIECPMHQGRFHIPTGEAQGPPVSKPLKTYETRVEGNDILVSFTNSLETNKE